MNEMEVVDKNWSIVTKNINWLNFKIKKNYTVIENIGKKDH